VVELTAVPAAGWMFDGWSGDAAGTANPISLTLDGDAVVTANFAEIPSGGGVEIRMEGEDGVLGRDMAAAADPDASGSAFVWAPSGSDYRSEAVYTFEIPVAGDYRMWARTWADGGGGNSFRFSLDGGPVDVWDLPIGATWVWDSMRGRSLGDPLILTLDAGIHSLTLLMREPNARVDRLVVTEDLGDMPPPDFGE
jgi:uncharacterized repeat protein (TIGR02543 family)